MSFNFCENEDYQGAEMIYFFEDQECSTNNSFFYSESADCNSFTVLNDDQFNQKLIQPNSKKGKSLNALKKFTKKSEPKNESHEKIKVKQPKKEYIRTKLIRGHKRAIRQAITNQFPKKTIHKVDELNKIQYDSWEIFKNNAIKLCPQIIELSKTENGPLTDGKNRRLLEKTKDFHYKTWNDYFVKDYFSNQYIRESFKLYIDVIFAVMDCDDLCTRFGFNCCQSEKHLTCCIEAWNELYYQLKNDFTMQI
ncbi:hypothetical protein SteCoe_12314 [Stentor coeruleus]|uniref:Uncharacterized protein n=1 Tax=Stentor coeruleus TaxID=5963 RepID=A0A1R2CB70_9CILI|nr:hypothetical protein SteCoe_12314 [Stentor coeruleus]